MLLVMGIMARASKLLVVHACASRGDAAVCCRVIEHCFKCMAILSKAVGLAYQGSSGNPIVESGFREI